MRRFAQFGRRHIAIAGIWLYDSCKPAAPGEVARGHAIQLDSGCYPVQKSGQ
jgi:hypothetical protein